jgi:prolyl-tRNA synthetase
MSKAQKKDAAMNKKMKTAISPVREENFPEWYQQVIRAADMAENSPVRGCMIIKPYGYAIWEIMQRTFDDMIKELGVQNAYFPLLIPLEFMSREAEHVDGFAKECAVVTHHRLEKGEDGLIPSPDAKLEEPFIIRPTSETIIGDTMARWVQSYRDLPLKLNQWCNVMRWEMRTRLFLRTSEFLWQEGHNCFETADESRNDAFKMLDAYADFIEGTLAVPVIKGEKTADERFPGADATFTVEAMMQDGKALQAGTSHDLGQNFSKSCGIKFQGRDGLEHFAHTTSWGISTRLIGGMIMTHGDDDGMIMPPNAAPYQITIIPVVKEETKQEVLEFCSKLSAELKERNIRVHLDDRDERTPNKMWNSIKKGVPLRVEIGKREMDDNSLTYVRRDIGRESKTTCSVNEFLERVSGILEDIQKDLFEKAKRYRDENIQDVKTVSEISEFYKSNNIGFVRAPSEILKDESLFEIMKKLSLTNRCLPFTDNGEIVLIGKAY